MSFRELCWARRPLSLRVLSKPSSCAARIEFVSRSDRVGLSMLSNKAALLPIMAAATTVTRRDARSLQPFPCGQPRYRGFIVVSNPRRSGSSSFQVKCHCRNVLERVGLCNDQFAVALATELSHTSNVPPSNDWSQSCPGRSHHLCTALSTKPSCHLQHDSVGVCYQSVTGPYPGSWMSV